MKFSKKIISLFFCLLLIFSITLVSINAATLIQSGDWLYERINDDTEFEVNKYTGKSEIVSMFRAYNSLPITSIGKYAFFENSTLNEIIFSSAVKYIKDSAFLNASKLETVVCKANLEFIDVFAFSGCTSLSSINLEDTKLQAVNKYSFISCKSLAEVTLPETVTFIDEKAFASCDNLAKITIPASVTSISDDAFENSDNVVIYCYTDSVAHVYAENNSIEYVLIDQIPAVTYILGDVDNSGEVSILDATEVQLLIAQLVEPQDEYTQLRADIDSDGVLSIMDATSIQMYIAGYEVEEPIGETFEV